MNRTSTNMWTNNRLFDRLVCQCHASIENRTGMRRARGRGSSCNPQSSICKSERSKAFNWQIVLRRQKAKRDKEWWRKRGKEKSYQKGQHKHPHTHTHTLTRRKMQFAVFLVFFPRFVLISVSFYPRISSLLQLAQTNK